MILNIISEATISKFSGDKEKFLKKFEQLYQLEILRPSLNLIATKCKNGDSKFIITPLKSWDRCVGHCQTKGFFNKVGNIFSKKLTHEIVIKTIESNIIMHEIAHAVEKNSGIDLNGDFRKVLGLDMNNRQPYNIQVAVAVDNVMKNELKNYKLNNIMEELFARFFEMLAMSHEVDGFLKYKFSYNEISSYFENTTKWVSEYFNPLIFNLIDNKIEKESRKLVDGLDPYKKTWAENKKETHYNYNNDGTKNWASGTKSTRRWIGIGENLKAIKNEDET